MGDTQKTRQRYAIMLLSVLIAYTFILSGLVYNYSPKKGILAPFYPEEAEKEQAAHPQKIVCSDLNGDGEDEVIIGWESGLVSVYYPLSGIMLNHSTRSSVIGLFASDGTIYAIDVMGHIHVLEVDGGVLNEHKTLSFRPDITDCSLMSMSGSSVTFAYTIPDIRTIGYATVSPEDVSIISEIRSETPGYGIDYVHIGGRSYLAHVNLADATGITLYPCDGKISGNGYHIDTGSRVTSALAGHFFSNDTYSLAFVNYNDDSVSFYDMPLDMATGHAVLQMNMSTKSSPYSGITSDINGDGLDDILVLDFKSNAITTVYPASNTTLSISVGRSPTDIALWHSTGGVSVCVLNKYSYDVSFLQLNETIYGPVIIGEGIQVGSLHHFTVNHTSYVLYASQSPPRVVLYPVDGSSPETLIYHGGGRITLRLINISGSKVLFALSDSSKNNISLVTLYILQNGPKLHWENISTVYNIKSIAVGDIDKDGDDDIAFIAYGEPRSLIGILYDNGSWHNTTFASIVGYPVGLIMEDVNSDGWNDVIVVDRYGIHYIYYGDGSGGLITDGAVSLTESEG